MGEVFQGRVPLDVGMGERCRVAMNWLFRDRRTGEIVIVQLPNIPLAVWAVASALTWLLHPAGLLRTALSVTATVALAVWAGDELVRGVNPWRRILGASALGFLIVSTVLALSGP